MKGKREKDRREVGGRKRQEITVLKNEAYELFHPMVAVLNKSKRTYRVYMKLILSQGNRTF